MEMDTLPEAMRMYRDAVTERDMLRAQLRVGYTSNAGYKIIAAVPPADALPGELVVTGESVRTHVTEAGMTTREVEYVTWRSYLTDGVRAYYCGHYFRADPDTTASAAKRMALHDMTRRAGLAG